MTTPIGAPLSGDRFTWILAAVLALLLASSPTVARGDVAMGQQAFDKGDYARAMSEWQSAADKGDAEGQLGLGKLYEFGLGDLAQNYKRADFWYRKAADQNNAEAQYRLALIWAVGGDDFPPDLGRGLQMACPRKREQGRLGHARDRDQAAIRPAGRAADQAKGKKLAADWKEEHAKPSAPSVTVQVPRPAAPSPGALAPATGICRMAVPEDFLACGLSVFPRRTAAQRWSRRCPPE